MSLNFGIIGAGLIGNKRAAAIRTLGASLGGVCDIATDRAEKLAQTYGTKAYGSRRELMADPNIQAIIVATTNDVAPACISEALRAGKHVLVEKPAGRNPAEIARWVEESETVRNICRVGFNHRFHPGLQKAKALLSSGAVGDLMYIRARYGHGGRIGYDKEWRANPELGGGGELLDQGVHLIDLCRWLGGEFQLKFGYASTFFWNMPVEDNGFFLLQSPDEKRCAWLSASCSEWKNLFDFEIFGKTGKLQVAGLGRSYGVETLNFFKMKPEMGPPDLETFSYPGEDESWNLEMAAFLAEIQGKTTDLGRPRDALRSVEIVYDVYRQSGIQY
jgi:predicted dehydrogenase